MGLSRAHDSLVKSKGLRFRVSGAVTSNPVRIKPKTMFLSDRPGDSARLHLHFSKMSQCYTSFSLNISHRGEVIPNPESATFIHH